MWLEIGSLQHRWVDKASVKKHEDEKEMNRGHLSADQKREVPARLFLLCLIGTLRTAVWKRGYSRLFACSVPSGRERLFLFAVRLRSREESEKRGVCSVLKSQAKA